MERFIVYQCYGEYDDYTGDQPVGYFATAAEAIIACDVMLKSEKRGIKAYSYQVAIIRVTDDGYYAYAYSENNKLIIDEFKSLNLGELDLD